MAAAIVARLAIIAGGLYLLILAAGRMLLLVLPVVIALFLATLLLPGARWLEARRLRPGLAAGIVVFAAALFLLGLLGLIVPAFIAQIGDVGSNVEEGTRRLAGTLGPFGITGEQVNATIDRGIAQVQGGGGRVLSGVVSGATLAASWAAAFVLALVLAFFFVKDGERLWQWLVGLFADRRRDAVREVGERSWTALAAYVRGVVPVATVDAGLIGVALLVVGVPLALPLNTVRVAWKAAPSVSASPRGGTSARSRGRAGTMSPVAHRAGPAILLVRHGETEWSLSGQHTGVTDIPLTENGRRHAEMLRPRVAEREYALVLTSPLVRARDTAELAGVGGQAEIDADLREFDYGDYEGITTRQIRETHPGWDLWRDGCPNGETAQDVGARVDRVIARALAAEGDVALFAHGHVLRVLGARWLELDAAHGGRLALGTAALCDLGFERERRVVWLWNDTSHIDPPPLPTQH